MWVVACFALLLAATVEAPAPPAPGAASSPAFSNQEALRRYLQGRLLEERGEIEGALAEYYRAVLVDKHSAGLMRRISQLSARQGENARSLEFAERSLEIEPGESEGLWLRGTALFNLGRGPEALPVLEQAVRGDSDRVLYLTTLARVAEQMNRLDLVERAYARAVELDEEDAESWFQLAAAEARRGRFAEADRALTRSAELNPIRPGLFFLRGWVSEGLGRHQDAADLYRRHLAIHADDAVTRRRLLGLLAGDQKWSEAYTEAVALAKVAPGDFETRALVVDLAYRAHRADAKAQLARLEEGNRDEPERLAVLIGVLIRNQKPAEARALADRYAARRPGEVRSTMLQARARALGGGVEPAVAMLEDAIEQHPDSLPPRLMLGRMLQENRRYADAARVWEATLGRFPGHTGAALDLARCREELGQIDAAQGAVRDVLRREPENPVALNFLGYLMADHSVRLEEARGLIQKALTYDPDNGAYIDSLGWVYYRLGRLAEARVQLERAADLTGGDPVVLEHLGDVYKDLKLIDLARDQYRKSLSHDATNQRVKGKLLELR